MKKNLAVIIFFLLTVLMTFPLLFNLTTHIPGFFSTDEPFGALWDNWRIKYSFLQRISFSHTPLIAYPFGIDMYKAGFISYLWITLLYFLSILTTPILTFNLIILLNFFFNGISIYLLVYYLTKEKTSGIFSGIIFAFCPYQFARIWQHLSLCFNELIVFSLYALILLRDDSNRRHSVLFFFSLLLLLSFDFSIMLFGCIVLCVFIVYSVIYRSMTDYGSLGLNYIKKVIFITMLTFSILFFQFFPLIKNLSKSSSLGIASAHNLYHRPFEDLFSQSARLLSYFLPAIVHPIFGRFTEQFIGSDLYGDSLTEHTVYLGWVPLILAFIAFRQWRKRRKKKRQSSENRNALYESEDFYIGFFIFLSIVAWLFSQPPWWNFGPIKIYMPSFFMYKLLPMYRAYCRFGIVLMFAVAVLAGFGLKFIIAKHKTQNAKLAITALFCGLVLFEFWNWPPYKVIDLSKVPAVYYWLKQQPMDFVIAEYPLDADTPNEKYKFYQTKHEKKIINGTLPGTHANKTAKTITLLSNPATAGILKRMGVKYVLVHKDGYLNTELIEDREELARIPNNHSLKFIRSFPVQECPQKNIMCVQKTGPIDVYEIISN